MRCGAVRHPAVLPPGVRPRVERGEEAIRSLARALPRRLLLLLLLLLLGPCGGGPGAGGGGGALRHGEQRVVEGGGERCGAALCRGHVHRGARQVEALAEERLGGIK